MVGTITGTRWISPLHQMTQTTATCLWNDSASCAELTSSLRHGAVGATCNPVIAFTVLKTEIARWQPRIQALLHAHPTHHVFQGAPILETGERIRHCRCALGFQLERPHDPGPRVPHRLLHLRDHGTDWSGVILGPESNGSHHVTRQLFAAPNRKDQRRCKARAPIGNDAA